MKKFIILLVVAAAGIVSCDKDDELITYDNNGGQTLVRFLNNGETLRVIENSTGQVEIPVGVTTVSDVDRTFSFTVDEDLTTADPNSYDFPSTSVTIPAGEYVGFITLNGNDNGLDTDPEGIAISIDEGSEFVLDESSSTIGITQLLVCPVASDFFVGDYELVNTIQAIGPAFGTVNVSEGIYSVSIGSNSDQRVFGGAVVLPRFSSFENDVVIDLVCNQTFLAERLEFSSGSGIFHQANGLIGTYNGNDDSTVVVEYIENVNSTNGVAAQRAQFELRKM